MEWKEAKNGEDNKYDLPGNWLKIEYFEALNILFRVENSLRVFVYIILKKEFQDKWKDLSVTSDDSENSTIQAIAKKRITQDKNYAYLGFVMTSPLLHLTSGELIRIIISETYWKHFKPYFLGSKEIIKNKLDEIGNVRNSLAHFRPVKKGDIELVKQNSIHTLSKIEKTLNDFIMCPDIVPTNTEDIWYNELKQLNSTECVFKFKQSKNEEWIRLDLIFTPPILHETTYSYFVTYKTLNLKSDRLLTNYPIISKNAICLTEIIPSAYIKKIDTSRISKTIKFNFSKSTLEKNYQQIKDEFEKILSEITTELNLIKEDNLARGKLIEIVNCTFDKDNDYFHLKAKEFETEIVEDSPVEFWGTLNYAPVNFITDTERYPWMPIDISEDYDLPF